MNYNQLLLCDIFYPQTFFKELNKLVSFIVIHSRGKVPHEGCSQEVVYSTYHQLVSSQYSLLFLLPQQHCPLAEY